MCSTNFERRVFHDTYREFQKKSRPFSCNEHLHTFSEMLSANEKAKVLHQKLQYSVMTSIDALESKIPVLNDTNSRPILFDLAELHIYSSDLLNKANHVVSLTYTSKRLVLHEIVGDLLILSYDIESNFNRPFMVKITSDLKIHYEQRQETVYS